MLPDTDEREQRTANSTTQKVGFRASQARNDMTKHTTCKNGKH